MNLKYFTYFIAFICIWISFDCFAKSNPSDIRFDDTFKITSVNAPKHQIKIGGETKRKNDTFRANSKITWLNAGDYIRVENQRTYQKYKVSGASFKRFGSNDLANYIHKRYTGTKGSRDSDALTLEGEYLCQFPWELIDGEVEIPVNLPLDENHYYDLVPIPRISDKPINPDIDEEDRIVYFTVSKLIDAGIRPEEISNFTFIVRYVQDRIPTTLSDNLTITYIPTIYYSQE